MPGSSDGRTRTEDLASTDELTVYHEEGEEQIGDELEENLNEDKFGLICEDEVTGNKDAVFCDQNAPVSYAYGANVNGRMLISSPNGGVMMPFRAPGPGEPFSPPPAHSGIQPLPIDPKTGLPRGVYPGISLTSQHSIMLNNGSQVSWVPGDSVYPPNGFSQNIHGPTGFSAGPMGPYGAQIDPSTGEPLDLIKSNFAGSGHSVKTMRLFEREMGRGGPIKDKPRKPHVKKPLNAFMLFMKEKRPEVIAECTLKESSAINQILGRKWHSLTRVEQDKYYELARREKELHSQMFPGWSARDNYAMHIRRRKRRKDPQSEPKDCNAKKCRARFGVDQQNEWCKPCRRKKRCIRFAENGDDLGILSLGDDDYNDLEVPNNDASANQMPQRTAAMHGLGSVTPIITSSSHIAEPQELTTSHRPNTQSLTPADANPGGGGGVQKFEPGSSLYYSASDSSGMGLPLKTTSSIAQITSYLGLLPENNLSSSVEFLPESSLSSEADQLLRNNNNNHTTAAAGSTVPAIPVVSMAGGSPCGQSSQQIRDLSGRSVHDDEVNNLASDVTTRVYVTPVNSPVAARAPATPLAPSPLMNVKPDDSPPTAVTNLTVSNRSPLSIKSGVYKENLLHSPSANPVLVDHSHVKQEYSV